MCVCDRVGGCMRVQGGGGGGVKRREWAVEGVVRQVESLLAAWSTGCAWQRYYQAAQAVPPQRLCGTPRCAPNTPWPVGLWGIFGPCPALKQHTLGHASLPFSSSGGVPPEGEVVSHALLPCCARCNVPCRAVPCRQGSHRMGYVEAPPGLPSNSDILASASFQLPHRRPGTVSLNMAGSPQLPSRSNPPRTPPPRPQGSRPPSVMRRQGPDQPSLCHGLGVDSGSRIRTHPNNPNPK